VLFYNLKLLLYHFLKNQGYFWELFQLLLGEHLQSLPAFLQFGWIIRLHLLLMGQVRYREFGNALNIPSNRATPLFASTIFFINGSKIKSFGGNSAGMYGFDSLI
jgi:hypothetical protein